MARVTNAQLVAELAALRAEIATLKVASPVKPVSSRKDGRTFKSECGRWFYEAKYAAENGHFKHGADGRHFEG